MRTLTTLLTVVALCLGACAYADETEEVTPEDVQKLKEQLKDLEKRVMKNERKTALDRINFTGDFRVEAHSIDATIPEHFNGTELQRLMVDTMFYMGATGMPPQEIGQVYDFIAQNYSNYLYFTDNLTWDQLQQAFGSMPPEQVAQLQQFLLPNTTIPATTTPTTSCTPAGCACRCTPTWEKT
jgi:hypothetical protein